MIKYDKPTELDLLYIQLFIGIIIGLVCYFLNPIIKENTNFIIVFSFITFVAYYLQKNIIYKLIKIENISFSEVIGNSLIICVHSLVFWSLLLNIF